MAELPKIGGKITVQDPAGKAYSFETAGEAAPEQLEQVRRALETAGAFLERLSQGVQSAEGNEEPLKIHFTSLATYKEEMKAAGFPDETIQRFPFQIGGLYLDNTLWLKTSYFAGLRVGIQSAPLEDTTRHELGHAIDDFMVQKTEDGKETGYLTTEIQVELQAHRQALLAQVGLTQEDVERYRTLKNNKQDPLNQDIFTLEKKFETVFPSTYAVTGNLDLPSFSLPNTLREFLAETWEQYSNPEQRNELAKKDFDFTAGLKALETYIGEGKPTSEAIDQLRGYLKKR